jgi:hypothetical protein
MDPQTFMPGQNHDGVIKNTIGKHPTAAAVVMGVLILITVVLTISVTRKGKTGKTGFEGLAVTPPKTGCPPGTKTLYSPDERGSLKPYCVPEDYSPNQYSPYSPSTASCKATWDPNATAEAVYLATVGGLQHDSYGEASLQGAINSVYDGLSDEQISNKLHGWDA